MVKLRVSLQAWSNLFDSVTQEDLLLIRNNLIWNLSPLMASPLPPTLYAVYFWSKPYKPDAPVRPLRAHEENMLNDLRDTNFTLFSI